MSDGRNRRVDTRWRMRSDVVVRVANRRIDGFCENISAGGIFLRTMQLDELPPGTQLTVSFHDPSAGAESKQILVHGRVVHHREGERAGVGLQWIKAETAGDAAELEAFLRSTFRVLWPKIEQTETVSRTTKSSHRFEAGQRPGAVVHIRATVPRRVSKVTPSQIAPPRRRSSATSRAPAPPKPRKPAPRKPPTCFAMTSLVSE